jgi:hypothetical protein
MRSSVTVSTVKKQLTQNKVNLKGVSFYAIRRRELPASALQRAKGDCAFDRP